MATTAPHIIEERRLQEQTRLDALKTAAERNQWGQFATPPALAVSIARYARTLTRGTPIRFLDPASGTGSFFFRPFSGVSTRGDHGGSRYRT